MRIRKFFFWCLRLVLVFIPAILFATCGGSGGGSSASAPTISIENPTPARTYATTANGVTIGGTISHASSVQVVDGATGATINGYVNYNQEGNGTWFADIYGLVPGENLLTATAEADGGRTAHAHLTVIRPLQPADEIFNGPDQGSSTTLWTDLDSVGQSHEIALFSDGTGRSTTGNSLNESAQGPTDFTWVKLSPDHIRITDCPICSFQEIYNITGSIEEGAFFGVTITAGGESDGASHPFQISSGNL